MMKSMRPIISRPWDIIDHIIEQLPDVAFQYLICHSFLHVDQDSSSF